MRTNNKRFAPATIELTAAAVRKRTKDAAGN
jgi:hypothetical protein